MEPLRTLLFVPGNRRNMIEKARHLPADVLVLDLEDSVPSLEKASARAQVRDSLARLAPERREGKIISFLAFSGSALYNTIHYVTDFTK